MRRSVMMEESVAVAVDTTRHSYIKTMLMKPLAEVLWCTLTCSCQSHSTNVWLVKVLTICEASLPQGVLLVLLNHLSSV